MTRPPPVRRIAARKRRTALVVLVGGIGRNLYCSAVLHILINLGSLLPNLPF